MEKEILEALKTKYKNLGFGDKAFEGVAKYLAATVTEQDQIETATSGVEILLKSFQGDIDSRVNSAVAKAKAEAGKSKPTEKKDEDQPTDDKTPEWAKSLMETNKTLAERLAAIESGKTAESRRSQLESKLKDAPEKIKTSFIKQFDRMNFKDDEDFSSYLAEVETEVKDMVQDFANNGLKSFGSPSSGGSGGNNKAATKEEAKAVVDDLMPN